MTLRALLFDMDGTVIDSDPLHARVYVDFLAARGIALTEGEYMARVHGRRNEEVFAELLPDEDPIAMHEAKEAAFRDALDAPDPMPGLLPLMDRAEAAGWKMALVTNACRENMEAVTDRLGIASRFDAMVTADDVPEGKPHPGVYLAALGQLGVAPVEALAFEDSPSGLASAVAAGLTTLGMTTSLPPDTLRQHGAAAVLRDFTDPTLEPWLHEPQRART